MGKGREKKKEKQRVTHKVLKDIDQRNVITEHEKMKKRREKEKTTATHGANKQACTTQSKT